MGRLSAVQGKRERDKRFIELWNEGWGYVTGTFLGALGAHITSIFTDDQKKITAGGGLGAATSGSLGSVGHAIGNRNTYSPRPVQVRPHTEFTIPKDEEAPPVIIRGDKADGLTSEGAIEMFQRSGNGVVSRLKPGALKGIRQATLIAHANSEVIKIGDAVLTAEQLADAFIKAGWEGGEVILAACDTGVESPDGSSFGKRFADALKSAGKNTRVAAPDEKATIHYGVPRVRDHSLPDGRDVLKPKGRGWHIYGSAN